MAYSHDNRIKYVVRYLYDIDNNGVLDKNDFKCLAVRNTIVETKGDFPGERFAQNAKVMDDLWNEIAQLADFDKNGEVDVDEFKKAVHDNCLGKDYGSFPPAFRVFIENQFKSIDTDGDEIDNAYNSLVTDADKAAGGIPLDRYKALY